MKVLSYSLWGKNPIYLEGMVKNVILAKELLPEWEVWVYCGLSVPMRTVVQLNSLGAKCINMPTEGDWTSMTWRFKTAGEEGVSAMMSLDADSRIDSRLVVAIDKWMRSDKDFLIIRDHPYHTAKIMGGLWGAKNKILSGIDALMSNYDFYNRYQTDQEFLAVHVYGLVKDSAMVFDEFHDKIPFPVAREGAKFCGEPFDENDVPLDKTHREILMEYSQVISK